MPTVRLPTVLDPATAGVRRVEVDGGTLAEALDDLCRRVPTLRVHLFGDDGELRRHIVCLHDGVSRRRLDVPVGPDAEIVILQAVSGGDSSCVPAGPAVTSLHLGPANGPVRGSRRETDWRLAGRAP